MPSTGRLRRWRFVVVLIMTAIVVVGCGGVLFFARVWFTLDLNDQSLAAYDRGDWSAAAKLASHVAGRPGWESRGNLPLGEIKYNEDDSKGAAACLRRGLLPCRIPTVKPAIPHSSFTDHEIRIHSHP